MKINIKTAEKQLSPGILRPHEGFKVHQDTVTLYSFKPWLCQDDYYTQASVCIKDFRPTAILIHFSGSNYDFKKESLTLVDEGFLIFDQKTKLVSLRVPKSFQTLDIACKWLEDFI